MSAELIRGEGDCEAERDDSGLFQSAAEANNCMGITRPKRQKQRWRGARECLAIGAGGSIGNDKRKEEKNCKKEEQKDWQNEKK